MSQWLLYGGSISEALCLPLFLKAAGVVDRCDKAVRLIDGMDMNDATPLSASMSDWLKLFRVEGVA